MPMNEAAAGQISRSAAEIYDEFFVPALFAQWAAPLCDAAGLGPGNEVLDVACGSGATTREVASRICPDGSIVGLDRNGAMLAIARSRMPECEWTEGRAEALPFADDAFDAVLCQFGLMFFDDRTKALKEMRRVLRPSGRLALSVWDEVGKSPGYAGMIALIEAMFGREPAELLCAPFALGDTARLRELLAAAGLGDAIVTTRVGTARFPSIREWVRMDVRGWTLAEFIDDAGFEELVTAAQKELIAFAGPDGAVEFPAPAHIVVWRHG